MEEVREDFILFLSLDPDIRKKTFQKLIQGIYANPELLFEFFKIYNRSTNITKKQACLIIFNYTSRSCFQNILSNFQLFSQNLLFSIQHTRDQVLLRSFSDVVYQCVTKYPDFWTDFQYYTTLFQTDPVYTTFCLNLNLAVFANDNVRPAYKRIVDQVQSAVITAAFQCDDIESQLEATRIFNFLTKSLKKEEDLSIEIRNQAKLLYSIAEKSITMKEEEFNDFWESNQRLNAYLSKPFYNLVRSLLTENDSKLSAKSKSILYMFIIEHCEHLPKEDLDSFIHDFFEAQTQIEKVDDSGKLFSISEKYDEDYIYPLFEKNLISLFTSSDFKKQNVAIVYVSSFFFNASFDMSRTFSNFKDYVLKVSMNSIENIKSTITFFINFFCLNTPCFSDSVVVFDFFFKVFMNCPQMDIQSHLYEGFHQLSPSSFLFNKLFDAYSDVPRSSLALFYCSLIHFNPTENNLNNVKYDKFVESTLSNIHLCLEKIAEINSYLLNIQDEGQKHKRIEYQDNVMILASGINVVLHFESQNPLKYGKYKEELIKHFIINVIGNDLIFDIFDGLSLMRTILTDFTFVIRFSGNAYELLNPYYDIISKSSYKDYLMSFFIVERGIPCEFTTETLRHFSELLNGSMKNEIPTDTFIQASIQIIEELSKWLYIFDHRTLHLSYMKFLQISFTKALSSPQLFSILCYELCSICSEKKAGYNKDKKWYSQIIAIANKLAVHAIEELFPKMQPFFLKDTFSIFYPLTKLFIFSKNDYVHKFFKKIMIPYYRKYPESISTDVFMSIIKMLTFNYVTNEELIEITEIINDYFKKDSVYQNSNNGVSLIIYCLTKYKPEIARQYLQVFLVHFKEYLQHNISIYGNTCSLVLLSIFNQDPEEFKVIAPFLGDIFAMFPISDKILMRLFFNELVIFIDNFLDDLPKDIFEAVLHLLIKYLSYQKNAHLFYYMSKSQNEILVNMFRKLMNQYCQKIPEIDPNNYIADALPDMPYSIQYIQSLL